MASCTNCFSLLHSNTRPRGRSVAGGVLASRHVAECCACESQSYLAQDSLVVVRCRSVLASHFRKSLLPSSAWQLHKQGAQDLEKSDVAALVLLWCL